MIPNSKTKKAIVGLFIFLALAIPAYAFAQNFNLLPVCAESGNCGICDFFEMLENITKIGFQILGAVALMFFILAGIMLIDSRGNSEKRGKATNIMKNTVIAVVIVIAGWFIVNAIIAILTTPSNADLNLNDLKVKLFGAPWNYLCEGDKKEILCVDYAESTKEFGTGKCDKVIDKNCIGLGDGRRCGIERKDPENDDPLDAYDDKKEYMGICIDQICHLNLTVEKGQITHKDSKFSLLAGFQNRTTPEGFISIKYHNKEYMLRSADGNDSIINSCDYLRAISPEKYASQEQGVDYRCYKLSSETGLPPPPTTPTPGTQAIDCIRDICPGKDQACCSLIPLSSTGNEPDNNKK